MVNLSSRQREVFRAAISVASTKAEAERIAFATWSESKGKVYANDGSAYVEPSVRKTPWNWDSKAGVQIGTAGQRSDWRAILRLSLNYTHDEVGSNGRSVGIFQQIPDEVGGWWGDMAGCLDPATSARRFLARMRVTDDRVYEGYLVEGGRKKIVKVTTPSAVVADVLRVQQPLASEAESSNYGPANFAISQEIAAQFFTSPVASPSWWRDWFPA